MFGIPVTTVIYIGAGVGGAIVICAIVTGILLYKKFNNQQQVIYVTIFIQTFIESSLIIPSIFSHYLYSKIHSYDISINIG